MTAANIAYTYCTWLRLWCINKRMRGQSTVVVISWRESGVSLMLTLSPPIPLTLYTLPYWSNPPFLIFDIRALWPSGLSARAPECQKLKIYGGLDQYGAEPLQQQQFGTAGVERVNPMLYLLWLRGPPAIIVHNHDVSIGRRDEWMKTTRLIRQPLSTPCRSSLSSSDEHLSALGCSGETSVG